MPKVDREQKLRAQRCARAAMTATLNGVMLRDKVSLDLAKAELVDVGGEGLLLMTALCMGVEFASFLAAITADTGDDPEQLWAKWCTEVQLPDRPEG
jgi:hypothetical protein